MSLQYSVAEALMHGSLGKNAYRPESLRNAEILSLARRVRYRVEPAYPEVARKARVSGIVIVECTIDKNGIVTDVHVLKPLPFGLDQAAVEAVRKWRFKPGTLNGQPVDVLYNLTVNFKLN